LLTDNFLFSQREKGEYEALESIMRLVDSMKGSVKIISFDHEGGKKLSGLGGIAALLRYQLS